jgi:hypothetical protein
MFKLRPVVSRSIVVLTALALTLSTVVPTATLASSCHDPKVVPIKFQRGSWCYTYTGVGAIFTGIFAAGQRVTASVRTASGASIYAERIVGGVSVEDISANDFSSKMSFITSKSGRYSFSYSPCADWNGITTFNICARSNNNATN